MLKDELANAFCTIGAFKWDSVNQTRLASGEMSPYYIDCRALLAHPAFRQLIARLAYEYLKALEFEAIGGLEVGAIPLAMAISDFGFTTTPSKTWRTFYVRKQPKTHGLAKLIEGAGQPGDRAVIVDDVLTSGNSVLKAIRAGREAELVISHALVIVDRNEQNGRQMVEKEGITVLNLLTLEDLKTASTKI